MVASSHAPLVRWLSGLSPCVYNDTKTWFACCWRTYAHARSFNVNTSHAILRRVAIWLVSFVFLTAAITSSCRHSRVCDNIWHSTSTPPPQIRHFFSNCIRPDRLLPHSPSHTHAHTAHTHTKAAVSSAVDLRSKRRPRKIDMILLPRGSRVDNSPAVRRTDSAIWATPRQTRWFPSKSLNYDSMGAWICHSNSIWLYTCRWFDFRWFLGCVLDNNNVILYWNFMRIALTTSTCVVQSCFALRHALHYDVIFC